MRNRILAGATMAGLAIGLSACNSLTEEQQNDAIASYLVTEESGLDPYEFYENMSFSLLEQIAYGGQYDAERLGEWGDEGFARGKVTELYADYSEAAMTSLLDDFKSKLSYAEIAALDAVRQDKAKLATATCAGQIVDMEWTARWTQCELEGDDRAPLESDEKAAYEKLIEIFPDVLGSDTSLAYFGGSTCKLLDQFAAGISDETTTISYDDISLNLASSDNVPCDELRDNLLDIRLADNPGVVIAR